MVALGNIHGTVVVWKGSGILILGPSGSGKSDLAVRLMAEGGTLVADDRVDLSVENRSVIARAPTRLAGKIELRGIGIIDTDFEHSAPISMIIRLRERTEIPRLPEPEMETVGDLTLPSISLHAFDASTTAKIALYLKSQGQ